jgi:hypothetical protein
VKPKCVYIDGDRYLVSDNLGFQHSRGVYAVEVWNRDGDLKIAIRDPRHGAEWHWAGPAPILPRLPTTGQTFAGETDTEIMPDGSTYRARHAFRVF